jgi:hypothetical protein
MTLPSPSASVAIAHGRRRKKDAAGGTGISTIRPARHKGRQIKELRDIGGVQTG